MFSNLSFGEKNAFIPQIGGLCKLQIGTSRVIFGPKNKRGGLKNRHA